MKEKLTNRLPLLVTLFCVVWPLLDALEYLLRASGKDGGVVTALRIALPALLAVLGLLLSDRRRYYLLLAAALAALTGLHVYACTQAQGGYAERADDLVRLLQLYALPVTTLSLITFLRKNGRVFAAMCRGMVLDVLLIAAIQLLSTVTGTDPHTSADGTGILGWFSLPNGQSAILAMLAPITICWALRRWEDRLLPVVLLTAVSEAALFVLAPQAAYGSLIAAGVGCTVSLLIVNRRRWKQALAIALVTLLFLALWPLSPTRSLQQSEQLRAEQAQQEVDELFGRLFFTNRQVVGNEYAQSDGGSGLVLEGYTAEYLEILYRSQGILSNMIDRFGRDRVFKAYQFTFEAAVLNDDAAAKIKFCELLMQDSGRLSRLFGLDPAQLRVTGYDLNAEPVTTDYEAENDFHGVYFHTGLVGLLLLAAFLLFFGVRALWRVICRPKVYFTLAMASFALAYVLGVAHALITDSVLRRGSAPILLAVVLAGLWFLSQKTPEDRAAVSGLKRKEKLLHYLPPLVVFFCVLQPVLDVVGYWQQELGISNRFTLALRILLLICSALLGFLLSEKKRYYFLLAGVLAALTGMHVLANLPGGYLEPVADLSTLVRIYFLPVTVLCFVTFLRSGGEPVFRAVKIGMSADLALILLVELLSVLTGTNRGTYVSGHIGVIGWFLWGNCQSAILSMLTVLVMCWSLLRWRDRLLPVALVTAAAEAALYFFGTRLAFASLAAVGLGVSVCVLLTDRRRWKQAVLVLLISALFLGAYPLSPAARRLDALDQSSGQTPAEPQLEAQAPPQTDAPVLQLTLLSAAPDAQAQTETRPAEQALPETRPAAPTDAMSELEATYRHYFNAVVNRFGIERVAEKYNYTTDPAVLGDARTCKRVVCELTMEDAPALCRYFGLNVNLLRLMVGDESLTSSNVLSVSYESFEMERDFHGIYYVLGLAGLVLTLAYLLYFGLRALLRVLQDRRTYFTMELAGFAGAYAFALIHAWFTTSVLRRNNASIYLALVLAGLWYLTQKPAPRRHAPQENAPERRSNGTE